MTTDHICALASPFILPGADCPGCVADAEAKLLGPNVDPLERATAERDEAIRLLRAAHRSQRPSSDVNAAVDRFLAAHPEVV